MFAAGRVTRNVPPLAVWPPVVSAATASTVVNVTIGSLSAMFTVDCWRETTVVMS